MAIDHVILQAPVDKLLLSADLTIISSTLPNKLSPYTATTYYSLFLESFFKILEVRCVYKYFYVLFYIGNAFEHIKCCLDSETFFTTDFWISERQMTIILNVRDQLSQRWQMWSSYESDKPR